MAGLDDLTSGTSEDFNSLPPVDEENRPRFTNELSNLSIAATSALLKDDPTQLVQNFNEGVKELESSSDMTESQGKMFSGAWDRELIGQQAELAAALADPEVTFEEKSQLVAGFDAQQRAGVQDERDMLARKALEAPMESETDGEGRVRLDLSDHIQRINLRKAETQNLLNAEVAKNDISTWKAFSDILASAMVPFRDQISTKEFVELADEDGEINANQVLFGLASGGLGMGSAKKALREHFLNLPDGEKIEFTRKLVEYSKTASGVQLFGSSNDYLKTELLAATLEDGYISDFDVWMDNITTHLDFIGIWRVVGGVRKSAGAAARSLRAGSRLSERRDAERIAAANQTSRTSPSQTIKEHNPQDASVLHEAAMADEGDSVAMALYGTNKADVVNNDLMPKLERLDGLVEEQVPNLDRIDQAKKSVPAEVMDLVKTRTNNEFTEAEMLSARNHVTESFKNVNGMTTRLNLSTFTVDEAGDVGIKAVYGPHNRGFTSVEEARAQAEWAFRNHDIDLEDVRLLHYEEGNRVPLTWKEASAFEEMGKVSDITGKPNYLLEVKTKVRPGLTDISKKDFSEIDTRTLGAGNLLTRLRQGSFTRHILDPASIFPKHFFQGVSSKVLKAGQLEREMQTLTVDFTKKYTQLDDFSKKAFTDMITEANYRRRWYSTSSMVAKGFDDKLIATLKDWQKISDANYFLENLDKTRKLSAKGFQQLIDKSNGSSYIVKPLGKDSLLSKIEARDRRFHGVYNPKTNKMEDLTKAEIEKLYELDGGVAKLSTPIDVDGVSASLVRYSDRSDGNYLKKITEDTQVLNYIPGYYPVRYKHPIFVIKRFKDSTGRVVERAVENVETTRDAKRIVGIKNGDAPNGVEYDYRPDEKLTRSFASREGFDDGRDALEWDVLSNSGRLSQRHRGKLLEGSDATANGRPTHIQDPVEAIATQMRSISNRIPMREAIDVIKSRAINSYKDLLPKNRWGEAMWTNKPELIEVKRGGLMEKRAKDLRAQIEYVSSLEEGYIDAIDDGWKSGLRILASVAGEGDIPKLEKFFHFAADARGPGAMIKNTAFQAYIATNPLRAFLINSHQMVQILGQNPKWMGSRAVPEMTYMSLRQLREGDSLLAKGTKAFNKHVKAESVFLKSLGMSAEEGEEMFKAFQKSGLAANITKHDIMRGAFKDLADNIISRGKGTKVGNAARSLITLPRKLGFDAGEYTNILAAWLSHRDVARKAGLNLKDANVLDDITTSAANFSYNMNKSGELAWQSNSLSIIGQFLSAPWKAMLTMTTNRGLSWGQKGRLIALNGLMYTLPTNLMLSLLGDNVPDDPVARSFLLNGLEGTVYNQLQTQIAGEQVMTDWNGLAPWDVHGVLDTFFSIALTDPATLLTETPGGRLYLGDNAQIQTFVGTAARFTNFMEDPLRPTRAGEVLHEFARISSGYSNYFRSAYARESGQYISNSLNVLSEDVNKAEAFNMMFGMPPLTATQGFWVDDELYTKSKDFDEDMENWYKEYKRKQFADGITPKEMEYVTELNSAAWVVWNSNPQMADKARKTLRKLVLRDISQGDTRFVKAIQRMWPISTESELISWVKSSADLDDRQRANIIKYIEEFKEGQ